MYSSLEQNKTDDAVVPLESHSIALGKHSIWPSSIANANTAWPSNTDSTGLSSWYYRPHNSCQGGTIQHSWAASWWHNAACKPTWWLRWGARQHASRPEVSRQTAHLSWAAAWQHRWGARQHASGPEVSRQTMMGPSSAAGRTSSLPVTREGSSSTHPAAWHSSTSREGCSHMMWASFSGLISSGGRVRHGAAYGATGVKRSAQGWEMGEVRYICIYGA